MLASTLLLALAGVGQEPSVLVPDRIRQIDSSGSIVLAQSTPGAKTFSIQLFAAARSAGESRSSHGHRHLLEHLLAKGVKGDLAFRLEAEGLTLRAETYRDFMTFQIDGPAGHWRPALDAVRELLRPAPWSAAQLEAERAILAQELALAGFASKISSAAWTAAYGEIGLDPHGTVEGFASATPEGLSDLFRRTLAADQLTLSYAGPAPSAEFMAEAAKAVSVGPPALKQPWRPRTMGTPGRTQVEGGSGAFVPVPSASNPLTAWTLAAALAIGAGEGDWYVAYTPSLQPGLVTLGSQDANRLEAAIAAAAKNPDSLFALGKQLAQQWANRYRRTPAGRSFWNGAFQCQAVGGKPELLEEAIDSMQPADFARGMHSWAQAVGAR